MLPRVRGRNFLDRTSGGGLTSPVAAADVKHRYTIGSWRFANKPSGAGTTNMLLNGDLSYATSRAINLQRWSYYGSAAAAGSPLLLEVSVNGGGAWAQFASIAVGIITDQGALTGAPIAVAAGAEIRVRAVSDASWTPATVDPQVWFEVEEQ